METPTERLNTSQAAVVVGLSRRTLEKLRTQGGGPEYFKPTRRVVYDRKTLEIWLAGKRRRSTSDPGPAEAA